MDNRPLLVGTWFGAASTTLLFSIIFLIYLSTIQVVLPSSQNFKLYTALPQSQTEISSSLDIRDARAKILEQFFKSYHSTLTSYSDCFIQVADKYKLDYRLLPAISMQESNGGRKVILNSFNPFGFGIYGSKVIKFNSWEEAIETVGKALRQDYLNQGLNTPEKIMTKYTPPSLAKGEAWAKGVSTFMEELR